MMLGIYYFATTQLWPDLQLVGDAIFEPMMLIVITVAGILMTFGSVGMRISHNFGATVLGGIFSAIGYVVRTVISAIGWCLRQFLQAIPRVYTGSRNQFRGMGLNVALSNVLASIITLLFIVVII